MPNKNMIQFIKNSGSATNINYITDVRRDTILFISIWAD